MNRLLPILLALVAVAPAGGGALVLVTRDGLNTPVGDEALCFVVSVESRRAEDDSVLSLRLANQHGEPFAVREGGVLTYQGDRRRVLAHRRAYWIIRTRNGSTRCRFQIELQQQKEGWFETEVVLSASDDIRNSYLQVEYELQPQAGAPAGLATFEFKVDEYLDQGPLAITFSPKPPGPADADIH